MAIPPDKPLDLSESESNPSSSGPKQSRKPRVDDAEFKVNLPSYDPKSLLDPKAGAKSSTTNAAETAQHDQPMNGDSQQTESQAGDANVGSLYERHHGVINREAQATSKRKAPNPTNGIIDDDEEAHKKQKTTFNGAGRGGALSEHLKKEREAHAAAADPAQPIDLTDDKEDDDVVLVDESIMTQEVCMGVLEVKANCTIVPAVSIVMASKIGKEFWPVIKVNLSRQKNVNQVIEVLDGTKRVFGRIDYAAATALVPLMDGANISKLRMKAHLRQRRKAAGEEPGQPISQALDLVLTLYAPRNRADALGKWLSKKNLWLRNPVVVDHGREIYNPHDIRPTNYAPRTSTTTVGAGRGVTTGSFVLRTVEEMRREAGTMFDNLIKNENLGEMEPDSNIITTPLMKHQKQALKFLHEHEVVDFTTGDEQSLWKSHIKPDGSRAWYNIITGYEVTEKPEPTRGGLLADMMGLGKTLSILALIAATKPEASVFRRTHVPEEVSTLR